MKLVIFVNGLLASSVGAVAIASYEQASRLVPSLAPRAGDDQPAKPPMTGYGNNEKNFTHDELFALQKRFLDNFVAPKNAIQVRCPALDFKVTSTDYLSF